MSIGRAKLHWWMLWDAKFIITAPIFLPLHFYHTGSSRIIFWCWNINVERVIIVIISSYCIFDEVTLVESRGGVEERSFAQNLLKLAFVKFIDIQWRFMTVERMLEFFIVTWYWRRRGLSWESWLSRFSPQHDFCFLFVDFFVISDESISNLLMIHCDYLRDRER